MWFKILLKPKTKFTESSALGDGFIKTRYIPTTHMKPLFGQAKPPPQPVPIFALCLLHACEKNVNLDPELALLKISLRC